MYAMLLQETDPVKLNKLLDEPLAAEMTEEERQLAEIRRIADANRAAVAQIGRTAGMRVAER